MDELGLEDDSVIEVFVKVPNKEEETDVPSSFRQPEDGCQARCHER